MIPYSFVTTVYRRPFNYAVHAFKKPTVIPKSVQFVESITITDSISFITSKEFSETITTTDSFAKDVSKELSETITLTDALGKNINKDIQEQINIADEIEIELVPVLQPFGGGGKNARGNIPRKTARGVITVRGGKASLTAPKRPRGGIF